ncbi:MAG: hypothetical protein AMXMBFR84_04920 [Candidatus Hydrogenedentota bacterium]
MSNGYNEPVRLGCGTLILIAIIVMAFSGGGSVHTKQEINTLRQDVQRLEEKIDRLTDLLHAQQAGKPVANAGDVVDALEQEP